MPVSNVRTMLLLASASLLAACGGTSNETDLDVIDAELVDAGNRADPAVTGALSDQIMVDPSLAQQKNGMVVRPPSEPYGAPKPATDVAAGGEGGATIAGERLTRAPAPVRSGAECTDCTAARQSVTLGGLAARQRTARSGGCAANLDYSASWANRLPRELPLVPGARVTEAAGANGGDCALRVVSFQSDQPVQTLLDWYYTRATRAGFTGEVQADGDDRVLGGTRARDDGAYVVFVRPRRGGGSEAEVVVNKGV